MLEHLGPAGTQLHRRQGGQDVDVGQDQPRLVEGADEVLAARGVDGRLAADRTVDLGQKGRGDLNEVDAAHIESRRQTGEVADHAAAQGHDHILAV